MTFIWPSMLLLLVLLPPLVAAYIYMLQRRRALAESFGNSGPTQAGVAGTRAGASRGLRRHIPSVLFMLALVILIVALARPQTVVGLPRVEGTVILAFDVSGSMGADDLKPTRMEAAKAAARSF